MITKAIFMVAWVVLHDGTADSNILKGPAVATLETCQALALPSYLNSIIAGAKVKKQQIAKISGECFEVKLNSQPGGF